MFSLKEILDVPRLNDILDSLEEVQGVPSAVLDIDGNILTATAWQDVCTQFHRLNPDVEKQCKISDRYIEKKLQDHEPLAFYRCPMGLIDAAMPILVDGQHLGNVFVGQLFTDPADEEFFLNQARKYFFDEDLYLSAIRKVPIIPEDKIKIALRFIHSMTQLIAEQGWNLKQRERAEQDLLKGQQLLEQMGAISGVGGWLYDLDTESLQWTQEHFTVFELSPDHVPNVEEAIAFFTEESKPIITKAVQRLIEDGEPYDLELELVTAKGNLRHVHSKGVADQGNRRIYGAIQDITERKKTEQKIAQEKALLRSVLDAADDLVYFKDSEGKYLGCNKAAEKFLGIEEAEQLGKTDFDFFDEDVALQVANDDQAVIAKGTSVCKEEYIEIPSKGLLVFDTIKAPIYIESGKPYGLVGISRDVTARKKAEGELLKSKQLLEQMGRISGVGGWSIDIDTETLDWTDEVYKIHEVESGYVPKVESAIDFYTDESKPIITEAVQRVVNDAEPFDLELEVITAKGNRRIVHSLGIPDIEHRRVYGTFQDITDRKRTEDEKQRLANRLLLAKSSADLGVWDWNVCDDSIVCDDRMFELYGLKREENSNHLDAWINAVHPEDKDAVKTEIESVLNGQNNLDIEFRVLHSDGTIKYIKGNGLVIMGANGKPERLLGVNSDVTAQKVLEEKYRRLLESTHTIPWEFDLRNGKFTYVGSQLEDILGVPAREWRTLDDWLDTVHPDDRKWATDYCTRETWANRDHIFEYRAIDSAGNLRWLSDDVAVVTEDGNPIRLVGFISDVTSRKNAEISVEEYKNRLRMLLDSAAEGIYGVDNNGRCQFFNKSAQQMLGYEESKLIGKNLHELLSHTATDGTLIPTAKCSIDKVISTGKPCHELDGVLWTVDGDSLAVEYHIHPVINEDNVDGVVVTFSDISERKKLLEKRIVAGQLTALGELAAGAAHEINNPINGVINYAQILLNKVTLSSEEQDILERIIKESGRIADIVSRLLNFSHKDSDLQQLVSLHDVIEESIALIEKSIIKDGIILNIEVEDGLPKIFGNTQQLEQVLLNLLSNARHALNEKFNDASPGKKLSISARKTEDDGVQLVVYDHGAGISEENLKSIFNRFYTTKPAGIGTGLGLSIVHDILTQHGASISITSVLNQFTKVTIDFPYK